MFDKNLVHAIVGGKDLDCGAAELSVNLGLTRGHGSYSLTIYRCFAQILVLTIEP